MRKFGKRTCRQKKFFAQNFYLQTLAKHFSLRESSIFRPKVLFANFPSFPKFESSEKELFAKQNFFAQKFYLRTLAEKFSLRESSVLRPKFLFANFRTFQKCESSQIELLSGKSNFRGVTFAWKIELSRSDKFLAKVRK